MEETLMSIQDRIRNVNWADYETAYENANEIILAELFCFKEYISLNKYDNSQGVYKSKQI